MPIELQKISRGKAGFFRFKRIDGQYLLTDDVGNYCFLGDTVFEAFLSGELEKKHADKFLEMKDKGFIRDALDFNSLGQRYASKNAFLNQSPSLHIVILTLRCDHSCIYCQAGAQSMDNQQLDMSIPIAEKVVDRIFESPGKNISIEFQGGEPLLNWETMKFVIEYARKKNKEVKKDLRVVLVSNLSFMTEEKLDFLIKNEIGICTSLDGQKNLHNKNRPNRENDNHGNTLKWIKKIKEAVKDNKNYRYRINALTTITKFSLSCYKEIVDEYVRLGLEAVHLRPINPFGINSKKVWDKISFSAEEFMGFYKKALDYIIELNIKKEAKFYERTAKIFLAKILTDKDPNYLDIRSPCGAGIGQLAYNFNGDVYTCDEGRMLSVAADESFRVGNVIQDSYEKLINNEVVKTMCLASCLDSLPVCSECVYKPYCGVCPIYNYITEKNIFSRIPHNQRCKIHMGIMDYLFEGLKNKQIKGVFEQWIIN